MSWKARIMLLGVFMLIWVGSPARASFSLWPLLTCERQEGCLRLEVLGPLFFWQREGEEVQWGLRPIISRTVGPGFDRWEFLYPLGKLEKTPDGEKGYLFPIWSKEEDFTLLFTAFWGKDRGGTSYGGIFPFFGEIRDRFGRDRIWFFLWPLYTRIEDGGTLTLKLLWPLLKVYRGRTHGFALFPLYGRRELPGRKEGFFLWPLYIWRDEERAEGTFSFRLCFPLFASTRSPRASSFFLIPPFFHHRKRCEPPRERWELWPFLLFEENEKRIFPLFRVKVSEGKERRWFLWPLYVSEYDRTSGMEIRRERFLLLSGQRTVSSDRRILFRQFDLWPLLSVREGKGSKEVLFPYLLPLRDEGLKRNLQPLITFFRYERTRERETFDLLWGLIRQRETPSGGFFRFGFLLERRWGGGEEQVRLLLGLISFEKSGERWRLRLLDLF